MENSYLRKEPDFARVEDQGEGSLHSLVEVLRSLKDEAESMLHALSPEGSAQENSSAGVLESIVSKYRTQTRGGTSGASGAHAPEYGVAKLIPLLEEFPVLEYWIYKKAGLKDSPRLLPDSEKLDFAQRAKLLVRVRRSPYRKMSVDELIRAQIERVGTFIELLSESKQVSDRLYEDLYNKHIEMQEDALQAQKHIEGIREYVEKLDRANRESASLEYDVRSREGLEVSTLATYLQKYSGPITEFYDDCQSTVDWLFEAHSSYRMFEEMIGAYSRLINALRRRMANMQGFISDFQQLTSRLKEGQEITRELSKSMVAMTASIYASGSELSTGMSEMIGQFGTLEALELPAYVSNILGGPAADLDAANTMLGQSAFLSLPQPGQSSPPFDS